MTCYISVVFNTSIYLKLVGHIKNDNGLISKNAVVGMSTLCAQIAQKRLVMFLKCSCFLVDYLYEASKRNLTKLYFGKFNCDWFE